MEPCQATPLQRRLCKANYPGIVLKFTDRHFILHVQWLNHGCLYQQYSYQRTDNIVLIIYDVFYCHVYQNNDLHLFTKNGGVYTNDGSLESIVIVQYPMYNASWGHIALQSMIKYPISTSVLYLLRI